ncbi:MAG: peptidoglycan DD-metalloendopeptidase family protein [Patescibacteria group bacterium]
MTLGGGNRPFWIFGMLILFLCTSTSVFAEQETVSDVTMIRESIEEKKKNIDTIHEQIENFKKKIAEKASEKISLTNQLDLLKNRIGKTEAEIDVARLEIDLVQKELNDTEEALIELGIKLEKERTYILRVIQKIQTHDAELPLNTFYSSKNFSDFFHAIQRLEQVNTDLKKHIDETQELKEQTVQTNEIQKNKQQQLAQLHQKLEREKDQLTEESEAKELLVEDVQTSESRFQKMLKELKQEQIFVQDQLQELQSSLQKKIKPSDEIRGGMLAWPVDPLARGVNVLFHDPTYPFRNLFEHSGIDMPAPTGTAVRSAAAGYVAWARKGTQYGNYVMVIHSDGIATLYAHLSQMLVVPDQFIERGERIGTVGMTGFATGPHLHFEVRKEGIPTNPLSFLPNY